MGFFRIRTTVDERPGRLASLATALADKGGNILGLSVQPDTDGTVDEFVTDIPASPEAVREALEAAGGRRVRIVPATAHELTDEPTRALLLAARLRSAPWRLPEILAELLRADDARWVYGAATRRARNGEDEGDGDEIAELPDPTLLVVPVAPRRSIRLRRAGLPFTLTEAARAAAMARLAQPPAEPSAAEGPVRLADGAEVQVKPLTSLYREALRDLHERCSPETRRFRYFTANPTLPPRLFERLCDRARGQSLVAGHDGQVVALGSLIFTSDPGIAEIAFLVEDRWQGRGLGARLARMLLAQARDLGLAEVRATFLHDNTRMRRLLGSLGATLTPTEDPGVMEARLAVGVLTTASPS
ncbi:GNAT family N-acetyltransferase [Microbispora sp. NPDC088329]|uniref:GNAT family N-acetyltransferase n=1 Tax=Microbispora sp. NPDC088329 TaxID=3154869 RepID=UPI003426C4DB